MAAQLAFQESLLPRLSSSELNQLLNQANESYTQSLNSRLSSREVRDLRKHSREIAQQVLAWEPQNSEALNLTGRIYLDENQLSRAKATIDKALSANAEHAGCWYSKGHIYLAESDFILAERAFQHAIEIEPNYFRASASLAQSLLLQGKLAEAFQAYRDLAKINPSDEHVRSQLFECLKRVQADFYNPNLEQDLYEYFSWDNVDYQDLTPMTESLIKHKYKLSNPKAELNLNSICRDRFLKRSLQHIFFSSTELEDFITQTRRAILSHALEQGDLPDNMLRLACSIATNSHLNEYCYHINDTESSYLSALTGAIEDPSINNTDLETLFVLHAMYLNPAQQNWAQQVATLSSLNWSSAASKLVKQLLILPRKQKSTAIKQLHSIDNATSLAVKEQYEANPYPRWLALPYHSPTEYKDALRNELPHFEAPFFLNQNPINILIAGCGTGRHALTVARYFRNTKVLAVDICESSLRYAQKMAKQYAINNVEFMQADILKLGDLKQRFHIIECSGVLHHMENPTQGATVLKELLVDGGLLKLGLYSERARREVVSCRDYIAKKNITPSPDGIRQLRKIVTTEKAQQFQHILKSPDFYNMSGCRDLLFHVKEHRYTPLQLQQLQQDLSMNFLGFVRLQPSVKVEFDQLYSNDEHRLSLDNWESFEAMKPNSFGGMYQFYLQK